MPRRLGDLQVSAHLAQFLTGPEQFVALGELADDLIRRMPPTLVRCHVLVDSSCPKTGQQSRTTTGPLRRAHLMSSGYPVGTPEEALDCACGLYLNDPT